MADQPLPTPATIGSDARWYGFLIRFALIYGAFYWGYESVPDTTLASLYAVSLSGPSVAIIDLLAPAEGVRAEGHRITSARAILDIVRGCDGIGLALMLAAAVLAFPGRWGRRLTGALLGILFVHTLNLARIVTLYFVVAYREAWFVPLHTLIIPGLLVVLGGLYFAWWVEGERHGARPAAEP